VEFEAIVVDPLTEPVPPEWDELSPRPGVGTAWDGDLLTALAWCATRPTLMAVVLADGKARALFHATRPGIRRSGFVMPGQSPTGPVMCHLAPGISTAGHVFDAELDDAGRAGAVAAFEHAVRARLGRRCTGFVYRQVAAAEAAVFRRRGRILRNAVPEWVVRNEWEDLDGYLRSLPARHRKNVARTLRIVDEDPEIATAVEPGVPGDEAARMLHTVQTRYAMPRAVFPGLYYEGLSGRPGARFFTYRQHAERMLLAFGLLMDDGDTVRCQGWGTRGDERRQLYFDHFVRQIGYLIDNGRREMVMGKGMDKEKARFGAAASPLFTAVSLW